MKFALTILLYLVTTFLKGQELDSLHRIWLDQSQEDTVRLQALDDMVWELTYLNPDSCKASIDQLQAFAKSIQSNRWIARSWYLRGNLALSSGQTEQSETHYRKACEIDDRQKDRLYIGKTRVALGVLFMRTGEFDQAETENLAALRLFKQVGHEGGANTVYGNLGSIALSRSQIQKSLDYFMSSLEIAEKIGKTEGIIYSLNDLAQVTLTQDHFDEALTYGMRALKLAQQEDDSYLTAMTYHQLGTIYYRMKDYTSSRTYLDSSLNISKPQDILHLQARSIELYASIHSDLNDCEKALPAYHSSRRLFEQTGDQFAQYQNTSFLAECYFELGMIDSATAMAYESLEGGRELGSPFIISNSSRILHLIFDQQGKHKDAYDMYQVYISMRDSTENMENDKAAIRQEEKYRYEKERLIEAQKTALKEAQLKENTLSVKREVLEKENERAQLMNWIIILSLIAGLITTIAIGMRLKRRSEAIMREKEMRVKMARELVYWQEEERKSIAHDLHDGLGQRLSIIKNSLQGANWTETSIIASVGAAIQEVRDVSEALRPQQLDKLGLKGAIEVLIDETFEHTEVSVDSNIDSIDNMLSSEREVSIYRIVQEAVNNIAKYAQCSSVTINLRLKDTGELFVLIQDDGVGFDPEKIQHTKQGGFGLKGIQERVNHLEGKLSVSARSGQGTKIEIWASIHSLKANKKVS